MRFQVVYRGHYLRVFVVQNGEIDQLREYENVNSLEEAKLLFERLEGYFKGIEVEFLVYHELREFVIHSKFSSFSKLRRFFRNLTIGPHMELEFEEEKKI